MPLPVLLLLLAAAEQRPLLREVLLNRIARDPRHGHFLVPGDALEQFVLFAGESDSDPGGFPVCRTLAAPFGHYPPSNVHHISPHR